MKEPVKIIEHEPKIVTTRGTFTESQWKSAKVSHTTLMKEKKKRCPIRGRQCSETCSLWNGSDCRIHAGGNLKIAGVCPLSGERCGDDCIMFKENNCVLF